MSDFKVKEVGMSDESVLVVLDNGLAFGCKHIESATEARPFEHELGQFKLAEKQRSGLKQKNM